MRIQKIPHQAYYFVELLVLLLGFFSIYLLSYDVKLQEKVLFLVFVFYSAIGIFHHKLHHTLRPKIVVEYILVSILIFACFLFLNTGKI